MLSYYNRIAGRSVERLAALSDGIFSVAMTLLMLDLRVPEIGSIHSEQELWTAVAATGPRLLMFAMSFITLGVFWTNQQTQLNQFARCDRHLAWIHMAFLFLVSIMPFSTKLLSEFRHYRLALILYWLNLLLLGLMLLASWTYANSAALIKPEVDPRVKPAIYSRVLTAQGLYAFAAAFCYLDNAFSIGLIVLIQLFYAISPGGFRPKLHLAEKIEPDHSSQERASRQDIASNRPQP